MDLEPLNWPFAHPWQSEPGGLKCDHLIDPPPSLRHPVRKQLRRQSEAAIQCFSQLNEIPNFLVGPKHPFERPIIDPFSAEEHFTGLSGDY
jgi:hypothetical protein